MRPDTSSHREILVDRNKKDTWILGFKGFFNP